MIETYKTITYGTYGILRLLSTLAYGHFGPKAEDTRGRKPPIFEVENRRRFSIPKIGVENRRRFSTSKTDMADKK